MSRFPFRGAIYAGVEVISTSFSGKAVTTGTTTTPPPPPASRTAVLPLPPPSFRWCSSLAGGGVIHISHRPHRRWRIGSSMSTNHLPLEPPPAWSWQLPVEQRFLPQQHYYYYQHQHRPQAAPPAGVVDGREREHLFEKPLTPSDVGKLNRLVIPKQHAERYFPLDGDSGEKGLLLSFEDEAGKAWRFRYSYWTSSQSYVLTKGWSRFVKEKRLDAGDVVLFERRRSGGDRLYIGWKRRGAQDSSSVQTANATAAAQFDPPSSSSYYPAPAAPPPTPYLPYPYANGAEPQDCVRNSGVQHGSGQAQNTTSAPPPTVTNSKRLRLFGVNLDCGPEQEPEPHRDSGGGGYCMDAGDHGRGHHVQFMPAGGAFYQL